MKLFIRILIYWTLIFLFAGEFGAHPLPSLWHWFWGVLLIGAVVVYKLDSNI